MSKMTKKSLLLVSSFLGITFLAGCKQSENTEQKQEQHEHVFTKYVPNNDATCTSDGTKTAKCDKCDVKDTQLDVGSKKGHSFTNYVSDGNATCTADGTKTAKCNNCDATDTITDEGSKLGHSYTNYVSDGNATCKADGTKTAKCDRCDSTDTIEDVGTKLTTHTFENYIQTSPATCTTDAMKTGTCKYCGATETVPVPGSMLGHSFTDYKSNNDATCYADGTKTAKCDRCDATDTVVDTGTKYSNHSFENYTSNHDATCTTDGTKTAKCKYCNATDTITDEGSKLGHSFTNYVSNDDATCSKNCTETAKCDRCDVTDTREIPNSYDTTNTRHSFEDTWTYDEDWHWFKSTCGHAVIRSNSPHIFTETVEKQPTCTEKGTKKYTCYCGYSYTEDIPTKPHTFVNYVYDGNATCLEDGTETAKCEYCNATDTRVAANTATGHTFEDKWSYDGVGHWHYATCEHNTEREGWQAHDYEETITVQPTCTTDGEKKISCKICAYFYKEVIPATGHSYANSYSYDNEFHWYSATCGHNEINGKEAHTFNSEPDEVIPATEDAYGVKKYGCTKCDYVKEVPIPNEEIRFNKEVADEDYLRSDATCIEKATYWKSDKNGTASDTYYFEYGDYAEHDYQYVQENGRNVLRCRYCDFDSSEDYSEKADSKLSRANIIDILLNSKYAFTSSGDGDFETYIVDNNLLVRENGQRSGGSTTTENTRYYELAIPQSNDSVYVETGNLTWDDTEYIVENQQSTLKSFNSFANGISPNFVMQLAMLDYVYDANLGAYINPNGRNVAISISNKKIADIHIDDVYSLCEATLDDSDLELVKDPIYETIVDGSVSKIVYNKEMPTFVYHNADKSVSGSRAYIEEEFSGYSSLDCGDYSNVDDDKLTSAQIADLVLNTRIALRAYTQSGTGTSMYYLYDNGLSMEFDNSSGNYTWELYRSLGNRLAYFEQGEIEGDAEHTNSKGWLDTYGHAIVPENSYLIGKLDYNPLKMATYEYTYDTGLGAYVSPDRVVRIYVQGGAISDIRVVFDNCSYRLDNDFIDTLGNDFIEDFSIVKYDIEYTSSDATYSIYKDHDYDPSYTGGRSLLDSLAVKDADCEIERVKAFFENYIGTEFNGEYYLKYDSSKGTYSEVYSVENAPGDITYIFHEYNDDGSYSLLLQCCKDFTSATVINKDDEEEANRVFSFIRDPLTNEIIPEKATTTHGDIETNNFVEYEFLYDFDEGIYYPVLMTGRTYKADGLSYVEIATLCDRNYTPTATKLQTEVEYDEDGNYVTTYFIYNTEDLSDVYVAEKAYENCNAWGYVKSFEKYQTASSSEPLVGVQKYEYDYDEDFNIIAQRNYTWNSELGEWVLVTE